MMGGHYLEAWLAPLAPMLARGEVSDLFINRPGEVWVETLGGAVERHEAPELDEARLWLIARQIANHSHQGISREHPLLAATLPDGARVQVVAPPATRGGMAIAIRKHVCAAMGLGDYVAAGGFAGAVFADGPREAGPVAGPVSEAPEDMAAYLAQSVRERRNILISGGTSSGKTTFLNALLAEISYEERLITIEDTAELLVLQPNRVGLIATRGEGGEARVGAQDLLEAALRMRPDRIVLGELRGGEAFSFLRAVNSGHPGSMTTIHADSPEGAVEQLALIIAQSGMAIGRRDVVKYVCDVVDLIVQLERKNGQRRVARIMATRRNP